MSRPPRKEKEALVLTPTTAKNLHAIGLALSIGAPVLLEGMTGAGKTALVEEVARKTGRHDGEAYLKYMKQDPLVIGMANGLDL